MSACDCCCEIVANYRDQRIAPDGTSFVAWINSGRNFHEYEGGDQDGYGPDTLSTDGNWTENGWYGFARTVGGGQITLSAIWGAKHLIDIRSIGTAGDTFTYVAIAQTAIFTTEEKTPTLGEISPAGQFLPGGVYGSTKAQVDAAKIAQTNYRILTHGSASLCVGNELFGGISGIEIAAWNELDNDQEPWIVTVSAPPRSKNAYRVINAQLFVYSPIFQPGKINAPLNTIPGVTQRFYFPYPQDPALNEVTQESAQVGEGYARYFNKPVYVRGEKVTLYKNGISVLAGIRPSDSETLAATQQDGAYLIVSEVDESTNRAWTEAGVDTRKRWPRPFKQLASFVVDRDAPVIGAMPPQDYFSDQSYVATGGTAFANGTIWITATKPLQVNTSFVGDSFSSDGGAFVVRPLTNGKGFFREGWERADRTYLTSLPVGVHTVAPAWDGVAPINTSLAPGEIPYRDLAGNIASFVPSFTVTIHAVPQNNRRGARPRLEDVGLRTREYWRARFQGEQVRTVRLTWDRKVLVSSVTASQLSLTCNGVAVEGCTISKQSDTEWIVSLPDITQESKTFWQLTYDPGGNVMTDDVTNEVYPSKSDFPPSASSKYKTVYIDNTTGDRYSKSPSGYVAIGDGRPLDNDGVPYDPEPCVLATRTAWLMSNFDGFLQPEDMTQRRVLIGTVPSITDDQSEAPIDSGSVTVSMTQGFGISDFGFHAKAITPDGYTPIVPTPSSPADDCSYWGLKTTIDPSPPREVTVCACPRAAQRHASVIRSTNDISTITLSMVWRSSDGTEGEGPPPGWPKVDFSQWGEVVVGNSFNDSDLPQNVWAKELPAISPTQSSNTLAAFTTTIEGGSVFVEAFRFVTEYTERKTAYLNELEFEVRSTWLVKTAIVPTESGKATYGENPADQYTMRGIYDRFAISKEQENALVSGQTVYVPHVTTDGGAYWWKIRKP